MTPRVSAIALTIVLGALALATQHDAHAWGKKKPEPEKEQAAAQHPLSPDVAKALRAAQEALQKEDWNSAYTHVQEAQAVATKTPFDEFQIAELLGYTELKREHFAEASAAFEQSIASGLLPPADATGRLKLVAQLAMQSKDYPKAVQFASKAIASTTTPDPEMQALLGQAQYLAGDYKAAGETMAAAVAAARQAGKPVNETWLQVQLSAYVQLKDEPGVLRSLQEVAIAFPKTKYLQDLFNEWRRQHGDDRSMLNLHRLMLQQGLLTDAEDYLTLAQLAVSAGMPGEAVRVLEQAKTNKAFAEQLNTPRARRQLETAKIAAAADRKSMQTLERASGERSGEDDVQLGLALVSFGEYAKGAEALQRGLAKGNIKRADQAQILLGQALVNLNRPTDAKAAFDSVDASSQLRPLAQLWQAYTVQAPAEPPTPAS
jgi:hypothetical protein